MASAFMAHFALIRAGGRSIQGGELLISRPFGEECEEAGDVLGDLTGILAADVTPETRPPDLVCPVDQIVV